MIMLRMYWALTGISSCSAFSTARTEAMACTVVHTPQMRWVMAQASRGSRPIRMFSTPRHIWPEAQAFLTRPPSTSTSTRRWPSMRVTGSMVTRLLMVILLMHSVRGNRARQHREATGNEDVAEDFDGKHADRDQHLGDAREIVPARAGVVADQETIDAEQDAAAHDGDPGQEEPGRIFPGRRRRLPGWARRHAPRPRAHSGRCRAPAGRCRADRA